jgi:LysM repeat protein
MKNTRIFKIFSVMLAMLLNFSATEVAAQKKKPVIRKKTTTTTKTVKPTVKLYAVETGTTFRVRMNGNISSKTAKAGDTFTTTVTEPVYSDTGVIVIPTGSIVTGKVDEVSPAKKGGNPGAIAVSFTSVKLPNGTTRSINGSLTDLNTKDAKSDNESTASGDKMKNRKIIFIGGGGAGGAVLGAAIGGGKGALIGGLIGAGAGLLGERLTKGEEAQVKSGTEFGVYLNQAISLPKFASADEETTTTTTTTTTGGQTYIVKSGDTLAKISQRFYGNTSDWVKIYDANRDVLSRPEDLRVGQELKIP